MNTLVSFEVPFAYWKGVLNTGCLLHYSQNFDVQLGLYSIISASIALAGASQTTLGYQGTARAFINKTDSKYYPRVLFLPWEFSMFTNVANGTKVVRLN